MRIIWKASGTGSYKISLSSWLETKEDKSCKYGYVQFVAVCWKCILTKKILLLCDAAASAEGGTKNAAAQEFEQLLMVHLLKPLFTWGELVVIVTLRMTASGPIFSFAVVLTPLKSFSTSCRHILFPSQCFSLKFPTLTSWFWT
jgi:hypothetical protein